MRLVLAFALLSVAAAWVPYDVARFRALRYPGLVPGKPGAGSFDEAACSPSLSLRGELIELVRRPGVFAMSSSAVALCDAYSLTSPSSGPVYDEDIQHCPERRVMLATLTETSPKLVIDLASSAFVEYLEIEAPLPSCARLGGEGCDASAAAGGLSVRLWNEHGVAVADWSLEPRRLICVHPGVDVKIIEISAPGLARSLRIARVAAYSRIERLMHRFPAMFNASASQQS